MIGIYPVTGYNFSFGSKSSAKQLEKLINAKNIKNVHLSFQDGVGIYNHLGYEVTVPQRGSHAIAHVGEYEFPLVIPHKGKDISPFDLKRLKYIALGDIERAKRI